MMKIRGALVDMLCEIALEVHEDFVTYDNNSNKILHINVFKLLFRMLKASILCYQKFIRDTSEIRCELNLCDPA